MLSCSSTERRKGDRVPLPNLTDRGKGKERRRPSFSPRLATYVFARISPAFFFYSSRPLRPPPRPRRTDRIAAEAASGESLFSPFPLFEKECKQRRDRPITRAGIAFLMRLPVSGPGPHPRRKALRLLISATLWHADPAPYVIVLVLENLFSVPGGFSLSRITAILPIQARDFDPPPDQKPSNLHSTAP